MSYLFLFKRYLQSKIVGTLQIWLWKFLHCLKFQKLSLVVNRGTSAVVVTCSQQTMIAFSQTNFSSLKQCADDWKLLLSTWIYVYIHILFSFLLFALPTYLPIILVFLFVLNLFHIVHRNTVCVHISDASLRYLNIRIVPWIHSGIQYIYQSLQYFIGIRCFC